MPIDVKLDLMMALRRISLNDLSKEVNVTISKISVLKNNRGKGIRFTTLKALCKALNCQPGDLITYIPGDEEE